MQSSTANQTDVKKRFHVVLWTIKDSSLRFTNHHASCDVREDDDCRSRPVTETYLLGAMSSSCRVPERSSNVGGRKRGKKIFDRGGALRQPRICVLSHRQVTTPRVGIATLPRISTCWGHDARRVQLSGPPGTRKRVPPCPKSLKV